MSKSEMVLVPRALLGAVASALDTGSPAQKTLASVRELYLSDDFPDTKDMQEDGKYTSGADWAQEAEANRRVAVLSTALDGMAAYVSVDGSIVNAGSVKAFAHLDFECVTIVNIDGCTENFPLSTIVQDIKVGDFLLREQDGKLRHMARHAFLSTYKPVVEEIDLEAADFSDALMWLKEGKRVQRAGWNGAGQWVVLIDPGNAMYTKDGASAPMQPCLGLKNAQGNMQPGWVPSMGDLMATDWKVVS